MLLYANRIYMVQVSYDRKPYRRGLMETLGARVTPSPSRDTAAERAVLDEDPDSGESKAILFNLCGHGRFDMQAYLDYNAGNLVAYEYPEDEVAMALSGIPSVNGGVDDGQRGAR
ncbi:MAG: hypothetical protein ACLFRR_05600 [Spirochaetaceae bacterium]